jgi:hypothetical protein
MTGRVTAALVLKQAKPQILFRGNRCHQGFEAFMALEADSRHLGRRQKRLLLEGDRLCRTGSQIADQIRSVGASSSSANPQASINIHARSQFVISTTFMVDKSSTAPPAACWAYCPLR